MPGGGIGFEEMGATGHNKRLRPSARPSTSPHTRGESREDLVAGAGRPLMGRRVQVDVLLLGVR
ncbi:hypothetical protein GCM10010353_68110 [Streptomyces chryseus]|uniref:Uncharacterized protein n=1 Tax=Streptomyces chryseus TaxID=68186 RepID=A0ABQ3EGJ6_9ACTN|nr:hypothetical protein GCM10010353_68110 [Streptomyces chryseus]GHB30150.1 hypothetical protein GCM10010346_62000 [Streptomyces chryseus]